MPVNRREFLKLPVLGLGGALALPKDGLPCAIGGNAGQRAAALYDATKCIGCHACSNACRVWNHTEVEKDASGLYDAPQRLSAQTWTIIQLYKGEGEYSFVKHQCMHCEHPGCAAACPVGALEKTDEGPVIYHGGKCIGCRYCMMACPFGVPTFDWFESLPYIHKCTFCADRLDADLETACVEACPTGALKFGKRDDLIAEARGRITAQSDRYIDHIYGEHEVGGTSWLYLSAVPFDKLGLPTVSSDSVTDNSEIAVLAVPPVLAVVAIGMSGIYWFTKRRGEMSQAKAGAEKE